MKSYVNLKNKFAYQLLIFKFKQLGKKFELKLYINIKKTLRKMILLELLPLTFARSWLFNKSLA